MVERALEPRFDHYASSGFSRQERRLYRSDPRLGVRSPAQVKVRLFVRRRHTFRKAAPVYSAMRFFHFRNSGNRLGSMRISTRRRLANSRFISQRKPSFVCADFFLDAHSILIWRL